MEKKRYTLAILVDNVSGVLSQVAHLFSRKGFNIEAFSAGPIDRPGVTRITIEILAETDAQVNLLCNQLRKLFPVHSVKVLDSDIALRRELSLIKVKAETPEARNEIIQICNIFRASIIDVAPESLILAVIGEEDKSNAILSLIEKHGILEIDRTGIVALERGAGTLHDDTKVRGEFNYGKNVR